MTKSKLRWFKLRHRWRRRGTPPPNWNVCALCGMWWRADQPEPEHTGIP